MANLPLEDIANIIVNLSPRSAVRKGFNLGLIVGTSDVITPEQRIKVYAAATALSDMTEDGFTEGMPEYKAVSLYCQQKPHPSRVAVGRWDKTEETASAAVMDCRSKNTDWYAVTVCGALPTDILVISEYIETASPSSVYKFTSDDLSDGDMNIFNVLKGLSRRRTLGVYSKESIENSVPLQGDSLTPDIAAAVMGYAMGANTRTSSSAFTLMHKTLSGVLPDNRVGSQPLDAGQVDYLKKINANYYVARGADGDYSMFENGVMCDGVYFDEILNLDMLVNDMQLAILDLMKSRPKIAQTESGVTEIKLAIKPSLEKMRLIGFIAPGKWMGAPIWLTPEYLALDTNDMLPDGYLILSEPIDGQSQADRDARKAPPIYTPIKLAGAIHTVLVQIDVNR